jgi:hypothetical protein
MITRHKADYLRQTGICGYIEDYLQMNKIFVIIYFFYLKKSFGEMCSAQSKRKLVMNILQLLEMF